MKMGHVPYRLLINTVALFCVIVIPSYSRAFELDEATIMDLQERMRIGTYTSRSIVEMYLKRVEEIDKKGPAIRSYLEINPDAVAIADQLDQERRDGQIRGPLHGIPILLKDSIDTADKLSTTGGSYALEGIPVPRDSFVAKQLRRSRSRDYRQSEYVGVGLHAVHSCQQRVERPGRSNQESLYLDTESLWVQFWIWGSRGRELSGCGHRGRGGWVDCLSGIGQLPCGYQAHGGPCEPRRHYSCCSYPGYCRSPDSNCG